MNIKLNPIIFNMVGFFIYPGIMFARRQSLKTLIKQKGAVIRERKVLKYICKFGGTRHLCYWREGALTVFEKMGKCALWGLRGRTLTSSCRHRVGLLIVIVAGGAFCVPSTRHRPHFDKESIKSLLSVIRPVRAASTIERSSKTLSSLILS